MPAASASAVADTGMLAPMRLDAASMSTASEITATPPIPSGDKV